MDSESCIQVLWAQQTTLPASWSIKEHSHDYYHLFFLRHGDAEFLVNGASCRAGSNTCLLFMPQMRHGITAKHDRDAQIYEVKFLVRDEAIHAHLNKDSYMLLGGDFAERCVAYIVNNWNQDDARIRDYVSSMLKALLLYNCYCTTEFQWRDSRYIKTDRFDALTRSIIGYIEQNYRSAFRLEHLAKQLGYTKSYLCDTFKRNTGITIVDYLLFIRIYGAAECLAYSGMDVYYTARSVGFTSVSYFSRRFQILTGVSPAKFRRLFLIRDDGSLGDQLRSDEILVRRAETIEAALANLRSFGAIAAKRS